jgi:hypothetical protein
MAKKQAVKVKIASEAAGESELPWAKGMSVQAALEGACAMRKLALVTRYYGPDLGHKVIMISNKWDGDYERTSGSSRGSYWLLRINGGLVDRGVDRIVLKPGDEIVLAHESPSRELFQGR